MKEVIFLEINETFKEAIHFLKNKGYKSTLLSKILKENHNYYDSDYLKEFDKIIITDTQNVETMLKAIHPESVAGVLACYDDHVLNAALLAEKLSLPHANIDGLKTAQCKDKVRIKLKEHGFKQPNFYVLHEELIPDSTFAEPPMAFPFIFKPVHEAGSQGVKLCHNFDDYKKALTEAMQCTKTYSGYLMERRWLLEEYIPGEIYGAQMLWIDDQWKLLGVTKEIINPNKSLTLQGIVFPADFPASTLKYLEEEFSQWANCIGLKMGALDIEFKLINQEAILIEINPRLAGARIAKLMELSLNQSVLEYLVKTFIGENCSFSEITPKPDKCFAQMFLFPEKSGFIESLQPNKNQENSDILLSHYREMPLEIELKDSLDDSIGYIIAQGSNEKSSIDNALNALSQISMHYKNNQSDEIRVSPSFLSKFSLIQNGKTSAKNSPPINVDNSKENASSPAQV